MLLVLQLVSYSCESRLDILIEISHNEGHVVVQHELLSFERFSQKAQVLGRELLVAAELLEVFVYLKGSDSLAFDVKSQYSSGLYIGGFRLGIAVFVNGRGMVEVDEDSLIHRVLLGFEVTGKITLSKPIIIFYSNYYIIKNILCQVERLCVKLTRV